jgi:hypothetical protein
MVVGFKTTCAISAYHHQSWVISKGKIKNRHSTETGSMGYTGRRKTKQSTTWIPLYKNIKSTNKQGNKNKTENKTIRYKINQNKIKQNNSNQSKTKPYNTKQNKQSKTKIKIIPLYPHSNEGPWWSSSHGSWI